MRKNHVSRILNTREKKAVNQMLMQQWGTDLGKDYVLMSKSKDKLSIAKRSAFDIPFEHMRVDSFGFYFGQVLEQGNAIRLSIEGSQMLGPKAKKNIFDISEGQLRLWIRGHDILNIKDEERFVIVRHKDDFYGTGKIKQGKLINYIPKTRRIVADDILI
jgi:NOL1/NOP2/fmu family ribosome biogenesis protein